MTPQTIRNKKLGVVYSRELSIVWGESNKMMNPLTFDTNTGKGFHVCKFQRLYKQALFHDPSVVSDKRR